MDKPTTAFMLDVLERNPDFYVGPFDYSSVTYVDDETPITLKCTEHGNFQVTPRALLKRLDLCKRCNAERRLSKLRSTLPEFITRARTVHGDKYDYSLISTYVNSKTKVPIRCRTCDYVFEQKPHAHLEGRGCKHCKFTNLKDSDGYLYVLARNSQCYKIGISNNPEKRLYHLNRDTPFTFKPLYKFFCGSWAEASEIESLLHRRFAHRNHGYTGFQGCTEWFALTPMMVQDTFRLLELRGCISQGFN